MLKQYSVVGDITLDNDACFSNKDTKIMYAAASFMDGTAFECIQYSGHRLTMAMPLETFVDRLSRRKPFGKKSPSDALERCTCTHRQCVGFSCNAYWLTS